MVHMPGCVASARVQCLQQLAETETHKYKTQSERIHSSSTEGGEQSWQCPNAVPQLGRAAGKGKEVCGVQQPCTPATPAIPAYWQPHNPGVHLKPRTPAAAAAASAAGNAPWGLVLPPFPPAPTSPITHIKRTQHTASALAAQRLSTLQVRWQHRDSAQPTCTHVMCWHWGGGGGIGSGSVHHSRSALPRHASLAPPHPQIGTHSPCIEHALARKKNPQHLKKEAPARMERRQLGGQRLHTLLAGAQPSAARKRCARLVSKSVHWLPSGCPQPGPALSPNALTPVGV